MKKILILLLLVVVGCNTVQMEEKYYIERVYTEKDGTVHKRIDTNTDGCIVILPEEYKEITEKDNLRGYWKNGVLYIEFDNTNP